MTFLDEFRAAVTAAAAAAPGDASVVLGMSDEDVVALVEAATELVQIGERSRLMGVGVVAARSSRDAGQGGLAQERGHRNAVAFVQEVAGTSRGEAARQVRLGQSLLETAQSEEVAAELDADVPPMEAPWHAPLDRALLDGALTSAQMDAISRGLGRPPEGADEAWRVACEQLAGVAGEYTVEDLGAAARAVRDQLDAEGAEARYLARHEKRSLRMWRDADGGLHAHIDFDDDGAALVTAVRDAAMRPRRGGPRFVDSEEAAKAQALADDPRSNEQLEYDLLMDVLRAGALADAETVFGTRQPGVRLVTVVEDGRVSGGHTEDGGHSLPAPAIEQAICNTGYTPVTVDACGNPLDVGREQRLFTPKQRIALAVRDGGCMWRGCGMPASYCEAHHIDEWAAHAGRTDIDRGILLCRFHHMNLHHHGHRITRDRGGPFVLHPPGGEPVPLHSRSPLRWLWDPPPRAA
ncbi:HNH endonuclease signature motif containing protein [Microbacterium lacusdiani]